MNKKHRTHEFHFIGLPLLIISCCIAALVYLLISQVCTVAGIAVCAVLLFAVFYMISSFKKFFRGFVGRLEQDLESVGRELSLDYRKSFQDTFYSRLYAKLYEIQESRKVYIQRQKDEMDVIHQMVSDISHQVKTPITTIKLYSQMMMKMSDADMDKQGEYISIVNQQVSKLDFLMQSLIKMSRLETGIITLHPDDCDISKILAEAYSSVLWKAGKKRIELVTDYEGSHYAHVDYKWTIEAMFNILDNAVKYTPEGGSITVRISESENFKIIRVKDNGCGFDENTAPLIFQRFYREERVKNEEGLGLGLSLSKEIIEKEFGYIRVQSAVGEGAEFSVYLPISKRNSEKKCL